MLSLPAVLTAAVLVMVFLPAEHRPFAGMTLGSLGVLSLLPVFLLRQVSKVGIYAHEVSHGVVSMLTGGKFHEFRVARDGGVCLTSGGDRKLVTSAGYVGTVLLGAVLLASSARDVKPGVGLYVVAFLIAVSTIKAGDLHTAVVGHITAAALGLVGAFCPGSLAHRFTLNLVGVILVWEGVKALGSLYVQSAVTSGTGSDAEVMAELKGRSPVFWTFVFGGIAIAGLFLVCGAALHTATPR